MSTASQGYTRANVARGQRPEDDESYLARGKHRVEEMVRDHEGRSVLMAAGAGFGVGLLLSFLITSGRDSSRWCDRSTAQGLGSRILHGIDRVLPEAISNRFTS